MQEFSNLEQNIKKKEERTEGTISCGARRVFSLAITGPTSSSTVAGKVRTLLDCCVDRAAFLSSPAPFSVSVASLFASSRWLFSTVTNGSSREATCIIYFEGWAKLQEAIQIAIEKTKQWKPVKFNNKCKNEQDHLRFSRFMAKFYKLIFISSSI